MLVPDLLKALQSGGLCWQMVVCSVIWGFITTAQFKQAPPVAKGLLAFVEERNPQRKFSGTERDAKRNFGIRMDFERI